MQNNNQTPYNGWSVSNSFLKRCFAIYGHSLVAALIIVIPIYIIIFIVFGSMFLTGLSDARERGRENMDNQRYMQNSDMPEDMDMSDEPEGSSLDTKVNLR